MAYKLRVAPEIFSKFPTFRVLVLYVSGLHNQPSNEYSRQLQRRAEDQARAAFSDAKASAHPHVAAWREAYSAFGAKPSRFPSSVEALLKRVLRGEPLPEISALVDTYNAISVQHVLPIGGEDRDRLQSDLLLSLAQGGETFVTRGDEDEAVVAGEVVWADTAGVTCRRWNWRQGLRTALTLDTTNAYFLLEALSPFTRQQLDVAAAALSGHIAHLSPDATIESEVLELLH